MKLQEQVAKVTSLQKEAASLKSQLKSIEEDKKAQEEQTKKIREELDQKNQETAWLKAHIQQREEQHKKALSPHKNRLDEHYHLRLSQQGPSTPTPHKVTQKTPL